MTTIPRDYESVWPSVWPKNECRSLWPIFHGPVILPYILKTIWYMNTILSDYELVWPDVWPKNKCRSLWPIFHGPVILPYILKTIWCVNTIIWDYESGWPEVWPKNIGHCDLYFMVQWFCLISWRLFDIWTPCFGITSQNDPMFDLKINVGHCDLYFIIHWFCHISLYLMDECHTFGKWVSVIWSSDLSSFNVCSEKHFSFIGKARFRQATLSCDSSYLVFVFFHSYLFYLSWTFPSLWECLSTYRKNPKISDTRKFVVITIKVEQDGFSLVMHPKDAEGIANSEDLSVRKRRIITVITLWLMAVNHNSTNQPTNNFQGLNGWRGICVLMY